MPLTTNLTLDLLDICSHCFRVRLSSYGSEVLCRCCPKENYVSIENFIRYGNYVKFLAYTKNRNPTLDNVYIDMGLLSVCPSYADDRKPGWFVSLPLSRLSVCQRDDDGYEMGLQLLLNYRFKTVEIPGTSPEMVIQRVENEVEVLQHRLKKAQQQMQQ